MFHKTQSIIHMRSILAWYGISRLVFSDNRRQYSSHHGTSCTRLPVPQNNGFVERESYSIYLENPKKVKSQW